MEEKSAKKQMMTLSIGLFYDANRYLKVSYYYQMPAFGFKKSQETPNQIKSLEIFVKCL